MSLLRAGARRDLNSTSNKDKLGIPIRLEFGLDSFAHSTLLKRGLGMIDRETSELAGSSEAKLGWGGSCHHR